MSSPSKHLVDPELLPLLEAFPELDLTRENLATVRTTLMAPHSLDSPATTPVQTTKRWVPGPDGAPEVGVFIYKPLEYAERSPMPCILHIHGGGYVMGDAASMGPVHRELAVDAQCVIVSVDYRLAPETPFPGAIEDCYAVLRWIGTRASELGVDRNRIGVMGESAGGGLAAALALLARDRGDRTLLFQHLVYPMIDDRTCLEISRNPHVGEFLWTRANNLFGWSSLLGVRPGSEGISPYAAAARATDLSGLPPTFISTGALDLFLEEDVDYARRLTRHGVPVELHVYPGAFHGFDLAPDAAVARRARSESLAALRRALHGA